MHCELYIPNFFPSEGLPRGDGLAAAETLIARGRRKRRALSSPEAWLFGRFGVARQRDWPVAPYTLLADGGAPERNYWMRADPVHLQVGRDSLGLADSASFEVSRSESEALVEALNRHFGQTMLFHPLQPARWYVRLQKTPDMQTTPATAAPRAAVAGVVCISGVFWSRTYQRAGCKGWKSIVWPKWRLSASTSASDSERETSKEALSARPRLSRPTCRCTGSARIQ